MTEMTGEDMLHRDRRHVRRRDLLFPEESYEIKAVCIAVHTELGCGFLEKVYESALTIELNRRGFAVRQQVPIQVHYKDSPVGEFLIDLLVDNRFIIEVKATQADHPAHKAQLINYLKAFGLPLGFLVNFGTEYFGFERVVFTKV